MNEFYILPHRSWGSESPTIPMLGHTVDMRHFLKLKF